MLFSVIYNTKLHIICSTNAVIRVIYGTNCVIFERIELLKTNIYKTKNIELSVSKLAAVRK